MIAGATMAVGALLPWIQIEVSALGVGATGGSFSGLEGTTWEGKTVLAVGIVVGLAALGALLLPKTLPWVGGLSILGALISGWATVSIYSEIGDLEGSLLPNVTSSADPSIGIWVTLVGAIFALIGGVLAFAPGTPDSAPKLGS